MFCAGESIILELVSQPESKTKTLLKLAFPLIVANSFWNLQLTIDRVFLGQYSTESLGAALAVMGVFWVPMALLQQTSAYVTTFVAQFHGAKEDNKIVGALWQSLWVSLFGGVLFLLLNTVSEPFFKWVGHSESMQVLEVEYFNSLAFSALPTALVAALSGFFTGLGKPQTVIWINLVGLVGNAVFDALLIFGKWGFPAMGVSGAGYATAIGTFFAVIAGFWLMAKEKQLGVKIFKNYQIDFPLLKQFLKFGLPSGFQWALEGLAFTVFLILIGRNQTQGDAALTASSIAMTIFMLSVLPTMGVAQAVMTLVGQLVGANNSGMAEAYVWRGVKVSLVYMLLVGSTFWIFPEFYLSWFANKENPVLWNQVLVMAPLILKIVSIFSISDSVYLNFSFALKGAGDTRFVSILALLVPWPIMVLPAYWVREWPNATYMSWAFAVAYAITITALIYLRFRSGKWKSMSVIKY